MFAIRAFSTWRPLLRSVFDCDPAAFGCPGAGIAGRVTREERDWFAFPGCGDNLDAFDLKFTEDLDDQLFAGLQAEVGKSPLAAMSFVATYPSPGRASIHLLEFSSAVEMAGRGTGLGSVVLVEGAAPELWTRQPVPVPGARPSKSADPVLLERTLRARLPWAAGVDEAQISAAGNRIGTAFPEELRALYRVLPVWAYEWRAGLPFDLLPVEEVFVATAQTRRIPWRRAAAHAAPTAPAGPVQNLAGSPGWVVFGTAGADDDEQLALDLTPGPGGHVGQVIMIDDGRWHAPTLVAGSLTRLIVHRPHLIETDPLPGFPAVARVGSRGLPDIESAVNRDLEVLIIESTKGMPPLSLARLAGHPRLRTLIAAPGTLADPRQIAALPQLEYAQIGIAEWRALLRSHLVPRTLLAAGIAEGFWDNPVGAVEVANALLALRGRPTIGWTVLEGRI